jgi:glycosyltransferase involved in cell wall biosynthesis
MKAVFVLIDNCRTAELAVDRVASLAPRRERLRDGWAGIANNDSGALDPQQIYPLRAGACMTPLASRSENRSYAALETMAQGFPLVSSDNGGQGEFVVDGSTESMAAGNAGDLRRRGATLLGGRPQ